LNPSVRAALELVEASLHKVLDRGLTYNVAELAETLSVVAPKVPLL
jgi:hypothetical protein